jgi:hypothetical protein
VEEHLLAAFAYFDKDDSGYITVDELEQAAGVQRAQHGQRRSQRHQHRGISFFSFDLCVFISWFVANIQEDVVLALFLQSIMVMLLATTFLGAGNGSN